MLFSRMVGIMFHYKRSIGRHGVRVLCAVAFLGLTGWAPLQSGNDSAVSLLEAPVTRIHLAPSVDGAVSPSSSVADSCLPLLKSIQSPSSAPERIQRSAGNMAAVGLILGVRYALRPPESSNAAALAVSELTPSSYTDDNRSALAVHAYRLCRKEQALKTP